MTQALSYRLAGTLATVAIVAACTGRFELALGVGGLDLLAKLAIYYRRGAASRPGARASSRPWCG